MRKDCIISRMIAATFLLAGPIAALAQEPKFEDLIKLAPVITSGEGKYRRIDFSISNQVDDDVNRLCRIQYEAPGRFALRIIDPSDATPILFLCDQQLMVYDAVAGVVLYCDSGSFELTWRSGGATIDVRSGSSLAAKPCSVVLDVKSLYDRKGIGDELARLGERIYCIRRKLDGSGSFAALVDCSRKCPFRECTWKGASSTQPNLTVQISIDDDVREALPRFPTLERLEAALKVIDCSAALESSGTAVQALIDRALVARMAIRSKDARRMYEATWGARIDWATIRIVDERNARALREGIGDSSAPAKETDPRAVPSAAARGHHLQPAPVAAPGERAAVDSQSGSAQVHDLMPAPHDFKPERLAPPSRLAASPHVAPKPDGADHPGMSSSPEIFPRFARSGGAKNADGARSFVRALQQAQVTGRVMEAGAFFERGLNDQALEVLEALLSEHRDCGAALLLHARIVAKGGRLKEAIDDLDRVLATDPVDLAALRLRARCRSELASAGDDSYAGPALSDVERILELRPGDHEALTERGAVAVHRKQYDDAIRDFSRVFDELHKYGTRTVWFDALLCRGLALMQKGDYKRAIGDLDELARCYAPSPIDACILMYRGECYAQTGDPDRSIADFTAAIKQQPDEAALYGQRAASYRLKNDLDHALADLDQLVRICSNEPAAYLLRLDVRIDNGDFNGAMADIDRVVQLVPGAVGAYTYRAVVALLILHDRDRALADLDRALAIDAGMWLGRALRTYVRAAKAQHVPALRDLTVCIQTFSVTELAKLWGAWNEGHRLQLGPPFGTADPGARAEPRASSSDIDRLCVAETIRLLAAEARRQWTRSGLGVPAAPKPGAMP
jgi:tetratricopeptide (TPR) repeat protein